MRKVIEVMMRSSETEFGLVPTEDKNCSIGNGVTISNTQKIEETTLNHSQYVIRDGIPIIVKGSVLPNGWRLT